MNGKILGLALLCMAPAVLGPTPIYAQERPAIKAVNVAMMDLDRCPFYPSPIVCRMKGMGTTAHNNTGTTNQQDAQAQAHGSQDHDFM